MLDKVKVLIDATVQQEHEDYCHLYTLVLTNTDNNLQERLLARGRRHGFPTWVEVTEAKRGVRII